MSKKSTKIAAGLGIVAALGVGVMPFAGAGAAPAYDESSQTDKLSITIEEVCSFGHEYADEDNADVAAGVHTDGSYEGNIEITGSQGKWDSSDVTGGTDTLSATMENSTTTNDLGSTVLTVVCNDTDGYTITSEVNDGNTTTLTSGANTIPQIVDFSATKSGWSYKIVGEAYSGTTAGLGVKTVGDANGWHAVGDNGVIVDTSATGVTPKTTDSHGNSYRITYGIGINSTQAAGSYEGTVTYTLASVDPVDPAP